MTALLWIFLFAPWHSSVTFRFRLFKSDGFPSGGKCAACSVNLGDGGRSNHVPSKPQSAFMADGLQICLRLLGGE